ncbi:TMEM43 family protein [Geminicoccus harenae]|uniref:TMEM43 family protein n=2 Tax=Geminicoccus harenae TaxID=2498453 RepID=UPI001C968A5E|nr:TMEM43 family protein [Geminicoccus harenae]
MSKSVVPVAIGSLILLAAVAVSVWHEWRTASAADLRAVVGAEVVDAAADDATGVPDGRFVRVVGETRAAGPVQEPALGRTFQLLRLDREVETAQWQERQINTQGGRDLVYELVWSAVRIDSTRFRDAGGAHPNPPLRLSSASLVAPSPMLGAWQAEPPLWLALPATDPVALPERLEVAGIGTVARGGQWWWSGDPDRPAPGDIRLRYRSVPFGLATMIGQAQAGTLRAPVDGKGAVLALAGQGDVAAANLLGTAGAAATLEAWKLRAFLLAACLLGGCILAFGLKRGGVGVAAGLGGGGPLTGLLLGSSVWLIVSVTAWLLFRLR